MGWNEMELTFKDDILRISSEWQERSVNILSASWKKFAEQFTRIALRRADSWENMSEEKKQTLISCLFNSLDYFVNQIHPTARILNLK